MLDYEQNFDEGPPTRIAADLVAALLQRSVRNLELLLNSQVAGADRAVNERVTPKRSSGRLRPRARLRRTVDVYETTVVGDHIRLRTMIRSRYPPRASLAIYDVAVNQERVVSVTHLSDEQSRLAPLIELLYVDGCPTCEPFLSYLLKFLDHRGFTPHVHLVKVITEVDALHHHFLGSPSLRINGRDVDPNAQRRNAYAVRCRLYPPLRGELKPHPMPGSPPR